MERRHVHVRLKVNPEVRSAESFDYVAAKDRDVLLKIDILGITEQHSAPFCGFLLAGPRFWGALSSLLRHMMKGQDRGSVDHVLVPFAE
jgi:hypothetical protein